MRVLGRQKPGREGTIYKLHVSLVSCCRPTFHSTVCYSKLHFTVPLYTELHCVLQLFTAALYYTVPHYIRLNCVLHCIVLHCPILYCTYHFYRIALYYIYSTTVLPLHCTTVHSFSLHRKYCNILSATVKCILMIILDHIVSSLAEVSYCSLSSQAVSKDKWISMDSSGL